MHLIKYTYVSALLGAATVCAVPYISPRQEETAKPGVRAVAILEAFQHSWNGYADNAFGADEVDTINGSKSNSRYLPHGNTIAVSLSRFNLTYIGDKQERVGSYCC